MTETNCSKITQYLLRKCYSTVHFNQLQFQCQYLVRLPWLQLQDNKLCKQECQDVSRTSGRYMYQSDQIRSYSVESLVYQQHLLQWHCARSTLGKCSLANVAGYAKDNYILGKSGQKNCVRIYQPFLRYLGALPWQTRVLSTWTFPTDFLALPVDTAYFHFTFGIPCTAGLC